MTRLSSRHGVFALFVVQSILFVVVHRYLTPVLGIGETWRLLLAAVISMIPFAAAGAVPLWGAQLQRRELPSWKAWIAIVSIITSASFILGLVIPLVLRALGVSRPAGGSEVDTIALVPLLYVCVIGPILEEIAWRGVMMRVLLPYGRRTAIIISALFFALMHHDLGQGIAAFVTGCILGYVALRYSLRAAIITHMVTNTWAQLSTELVGKHMVVTTVIVLLTITMMLIAISAAIRFAWRSRRKLLSNEPREVGMDGVTLLAPVEHPHASWLATPAMWVLFVIEVSFVIADLVAAR